MLGVLIAKHDGVYAIMFGMSTKIVVDTSVFISALIGAKGPSRELIRRCLLGEYQPLMGTALFSEYEAVMGREEFLVRCPLEQADINSLLAAFMSVAEWTKIYYSWRPNLQDEGDNHLIELAVAGNARIIATNNLKDFRASELTFPKISILKPEQIIRS
jgi:putative PIN family toxin of toxin-antitoxin system